MPNSHCFFSYIYTMLPVTQKRSYMAMAEYFDEHLVSSDYYTEKGQLFGQWGGHAASKLGLNGLVERSDFMSLSKNIHPQTGKQLTQRNVENRTVAYDFTFSVPKSVSIVYSQTEDREIIDAMHKAIDETLLDLEKDAETRVRINGKNENRKTGNLVWASFTHKESRPVNGIPDPHLHQHVLIFNATYDEVEGKWKAGQFRNLKANATYYDTLYLSRFAKNLKAIGYDIERNKRDFEIKGFHRPTIDKFSNRTKTIEERATELGMTYIEDKAKLGGKTRERKETAKDSIEIKQVWGERLSETEKQLIITAKQKNMQPDPKQEMSSDEAIDYAIQHTLERKSVVEHKELMINALKRGMGSVQKEKLESALANDPELIKKETRVGTLYTTKLALAEEKKLIGETRFGRGTKKAIDPMYSPKNEKMTPEQKGAVKHFFKSSDFITIIAGRAGTGKTWCVQEIKTHLKNKGVGFHAFAPSASASRGVQREDGFIQADTLASMLINEQKQEELQNGVIWVDEAGLIGNKTMNQLINVAKEQNARILLTGDTRQHAAIARGDALKIIQDHGGIKPAYITKIQRQKSADYKSAVKAISDGAMRHGLQSLDKMGAIVEKDTHDELVNDLAQNYIDAVKKKDTVLVVATTHSQGRIATDAIRKALKEEKLVGQKDRQFLTQKNLSFTEAQKKDPVNYEVGQAIQFDQNVTGFIRGTKYTVTNKEDQDKIIVCDQDEQKFILPLQEADKFSVYEVSKIDVAKGDKLRITKNGFSNEFKRLDNGKILDVVGFDEYGNIRASTGRNTITLDKGFRNFTHGYYTTSPASQGKTVNRVLVLQTTFTGRAASHEQFYVSASRGRFALTVYTDDKDYLINSVQRSSKRMTAMEVAKDIQQTSKRIDIKQQFKDEVQMGKYELKEVLETSEIEQEPIPPPRQHIERTKDDYPDLSL